MGERRVMGLRDGVSPLGVVDRLRYELAVTVDVRVPQRIGCEVDLDWCGGLDRDLLLEVCAAEAAEFSAWQVTLATARAEH